MVNVAPFSGKSDVEVFYVEQEAVNSRVKGSVASFCGLLEEPSNLKVLIQVCLVELLGVFFVR